MAAPALAMNDVDIEALRRECEEHSSSDLQKTLAALHDAVIDRVCDVVGIPPLRVVFVAPGSLPKTSSGKLQRAACKDQYHDGTLAAL